MVTIYRYENSSNLVKMYGINCIINFQLCELDFYQLFIFVHISYELYPCNIIWFYPYTNMCEALYTRLILVGKQNPPRYITRVRFKPRTFAILDQVSFPLITELARWIKAVWILSFIHAEILPCHKSMLFPVFNRASVSPGSRQLETYP